MVRKHMFVVVGLIALTLLSVNLKAETSNSLKKSLAVKSWDFEDGTVSKWRRYDGYVKTPAVSITDEALSDNYSLNVKFDDTSTNKWFDKGFSISIKQGIPVKDINFISFSYLIQGEVGDIRVFFKTIDENNKSHWPGYKDSHPVIGKTGKFRVNTDQFTSWASGSGQRGVTGKIFTIFISVHNKKLVNSGLNFSFTIDDILLGK